MKEFTIWVEGYVASCEHSNASIIGVGLGNTFDEAVQDYIGKHPNRGIEVNERDRYFNDEDYKNRRSNWNIYACNLFDNEADARKSYG